MVSTNIAPLAQQPTTRRDLTGLEFLLKEQGVCVPHHALQPWTCSGEIRLQDCLRKPKVICPRAQMAIGN